MKTFITRTVVFVAIAFASFALPVVLERYALKYKLSGDAEILILGNSHSQYAYNDKLMDHVANFSEEGESYFYTFFKAKKLLQQNPQIKTLLIEYTNINITAVMDDWTWGSEVMPYKFPKYASFMDIPSYRLLWRHNPADFPTAAGRWIVHAFTATTYGLIDKGYNLHGFGGYKQSNRSKTDSLIVALQNKVDQSEWHSNQLSLNSLQYLDELIQLCNRRGVKVFLVRTPQHQLSTTFWNEKYFQQALHDRYRSVEFLDFAHFSLDNSEFGDLEHLNTAGAADYSVWLNVMINHGLLTADAKQMQINRAIRARILSAQTRATAGL